MEEELPTNSCLLLKADELLGPEKRQASVFLFLFFKEVSYKNLNRIYSATFSY